MQYAKSMKEIRKQKKKRRKENKNMKRAPGEPFRPSKHFGLGPPGVKKKQNGTLYLSLAH
jgi:hypothetical protein